MAFTFVLPPELSAKEPPERRGIRRDQVRLLVIERATGVKCDRCWRYVPAVSTDPAWAGLCDRCQDALAETVNG